MNDALYEDVRETILLALVQVDDKTTVTDARHVAHHATFAVFQRVCERLRELDEVTLESALFQLGQRP